jgi:anti-sigma-K factor RskA
MSTDVHTLSGAYALNALGPEEAAEFRRHLDGCQACREEVRELQSAVARIGAAEAVAPPAALKARILSAADRTHQEPPTGPARPADGAPTPITRRSQGSADLAAGARPDDSSDGSSAAGADGGSDGRSRWVTWLAAAAATLVVAGGGAFGVQAMLDDEPQLTEAAVRVFEAQDAHTATVDTAEGGQLTVAVSAGRKEMAVDTRELPALDENHVYQLWSVRDDEMVSAAILSDPEIGAAMGMPDEETQVALTVEPAGGSKQPTTAPIVQVDPYEVLSS